MKAIKMLVLLLLLTLFPLQSVFAASEKTWDSYFPRDDFLYEHWAYDEILDLMFAGIVDGYVGSDGFPYVRPNENITRAQFVKIIVSGLDLKSDGPGKTFKDVKSKQWYSEPIRVASDLGIIHGNTNNHFLPDQPITRAEITKIIVLAFEKTVDFSKGTGKAFTDINSKYWAYDYIRKASGANIVMGYGNDYFKPTTHATRAQSMVMIHRALQQENSALPKDTDLSAFLSGYIKKENDFTEAKDANKLAVLYQENGTGLFKAEKRESIEWLFYEEQGTTTVTKINDDNLKLTTVKKANRFATVKATGMTINIKVDSPYFQMDLTEKMDIQYKLKKDHASGNWKIYDYLPFYDEEAVMSALKGEILPEE